MIFSTIFQTNKRSVYAKAKELFPPNTWRGQLIRSIWSFLRKLGFHKPETFVRITDYNNGDLVTMAGTIPICDVIVQVDAFEAGGLENVALNINNALHHAGYKVVLLILGMAGSGIQKALQQCECFVVLGSHNDRLYRNFLKQTQPKLVLSHYSIYGVDICGEVKIPLVQMLHATYIWLADKQLEDFRRAIEYTKKFIAVSEQVKNYSVRRLGINEDQCLVLHCGIDLRAFGEFDSIGARHEIRTRYCIDEKDFVFLSVGSINHQKNHIATVRAFSRVSDSMPNAKLVILGPAYEKSLLSEIEQFIVEHNLQVKIIYAGAANEATQYYFMADAFVSAAFFEGGPLVLLEALKANLPVITTKVGFAERFAGRPGIQLIEPPINLVEYYGSIQELRSTSSFEETLANVMLSTYKLPVRPNLPDELLNTFDMHHTYSQYVHVLEKMMKNSPTAK